MSMLQLVRHANRYREILGVLVKFGFREFFEDAKLDLLLEKGHRLLRGSPANDVEAMSRPVRLRLAMEELGPTFIKLGQILSTRPDLLSADYIEEFQKLQANVPSVPWPEIKAQLEEDFGDLNEMFLSIDEEPMAAASMAQAHRAVLRDGEQPVVLKILRPGIDRIINADVDILQAVAHWVARHTTDLPFDPEAVAKEFSRSISFELDLEHEGRNTDLFRSNNEEGEEAWFPLVYWKATRKRVLCLEEIKGILLSDWRKADLSDQQREHLVRAGAFTVLRQVLEIGFFHADPHPGNLFLLPDGRLCFIDCGMAGRVAESTVADLANLIYGVAQSDLDRVFEAFMDLGQVNEDEVDVRAVRRDLQDFLDQFANRSFGEINMGEMLRSFTDGLRKNHIICPADIVLMIKALTTIEGVAEDIDPGFDLVGFARPHVERIVKQQYSFSSIKRRLKKNAGTWVKLAELFPGRVVGMLDRLGRNDLRLKLEMSELHAMERTIHHSSRQMSYSVLISAMILASAVLVLAAGENRPGLSWVGFIGFLVAFGLAFLVVAESFMRQRRKGR